MTNKLRTTVLILCIVGVAAFRVEAQQPPTKGNGEAQQLRQEIQALRQQAEPLRAQIQQHMSQVRALREQLVIKMKLMQMENQFIKVLMLLS